MIRVPGSIIICGEWAHLSLGHPALAVPIDRSVTCDIEKTGDDKVHLRTPEGVVYAHWLNNALHWNIPLQDYGSAQHAITTLFMYFSQTNHRLPLGIAIDVTAQQFFEKTGRKSSKIHAGMEAALVVAVLRSLLLQKGEFTKDLLFKLAFASRKFQDGPHIAAAVALMPVEYKQPDISWLEARKNIPIAQLIKNPWPALVLRPLSFWDPGLFLSWDGSSLSPSIAERIRDFARKSELVYENLMQDISRSSQDALRAWNHKDAQLFRQALDQQQKHHQRLVNFTKADFFGSLLQAAQLACSAGASAKITGNLVIGVTQEPRIKKELERLWSAKGYIPLEISLHRTL